MSTFFAIVSRAFQRHLTYRAATIAGLLTNFFFGLVRGSIFVALIGSRGSLNGLDAQGVLTYAALGQAMIAYLSIFSWRELMDAVYTGEISTDLLRPYPLFTLWMGKDFGRAILNILTRGFVIMLVFEWVWDLYYPQSGGQWLAVGVSVLLSWLLSFAFRFLINLSAFWSPEASGFLRFFYTISWFFSGFLMPLRLFPPWVQTLAQFTPFPHMVNTVTEIYLGLLTGPALFQALLTQLAWALALSAAGALVMRAGVRRLVIQGG